MIGTEINNLMEKTVTGWSCRPCDYVTRSKQGFVNHIESKHVNIRGASCQYTPFRYTLSVSTRVMFPVVFRSRLKTENIGKNQPNWSQPVQLL